jgi:SnoaL-like domain
MNRQQRRHYPALLITGVLFTAGVSLGEQAYCGESVSGLQRLIDIEDIEQLRAKYANAVDNRRWNDLRDEVLAVDAELDLPASLTDGPQATGRKKIVGRDAIISFIRATLGDEPGGSHAVTIPVIEITSRTTAKASWRLGTATFYDTYVEVDNHWRMKSIRFEPNEPGPGKPKSPASPATPAPSPNKPN